MEVPGDQPPSPAGGDYARHPFNVLDDVGKFLERFRRFSPTQQQFAVRRILNAAYPQVLLMAGQLTTELLSRRDIIDACPDELSLYIFEFLSFRELCMCGEVSKEWRRISSDPLLWRKQCYKDYGTVLKYPKQSLMNLLEEGEWKRNYGVLFKCCTRITTWAQFYCSAAICASGRLMLFGQFPTIGVMANGPNEIQFLLPPNGNVVNVCCGSSFVAVLTDKGHVGTAGSSLCGTLGLGEYEQAVHRIKWIPQFGENGKRIVRLDTGLVYVAALADDGSLYTWGWGGEGRLGHGNEMSFHYPKVVKALKKHTVVEIAAGESHMLAVTSTGRVFSWGVTSHGRLGIGEVDPLVQPWVSTPTQVVELSRRRVCAVSAGRKHSAALTREGVLYLWGDGKDGRLGTGDRNSAPTPVRVCPTERFLAVSCGGYHSVAVTRDGVVMTCGWGERGQLGHGDDLELAGEDSLTTFHVVKSLLGRRVLTCGGGWYHTLVFTADGEVFSFGSSSRGALGDGVEPAGRSVPVPRVIAALQDEYVSGFQVITTQITV